MTKYFLYVNDVIVQLHAVSLNVNIKSVKLFLNNLTCTYRSSNFHSITSNVMSTPVETVKVGLLLEERLLVSKFIIVYL